MRRILISSRASHAPEPAFTLVEVVIAIGVLAVSVVSVLVLQAAVGRSAAANSDLQRSAQLADASLVELARLRDRPAADGVPGRLDALGAIIPASDSPEPLRLVAARDGLRAVVEAEADDPAWGVPPRDRYFAIEVRQQPAPLHYRADAGFLALTLTLRWPYRIATGPEPSAAVAADPAEASVLVINCALAP